MLANFPGMRLVPASIIVVSAALVCGCESKRAPVGDELEAGSTAAAGSGSAAGPGADANAADPRCASACTFLATVPRAEAGAAFEKLCGEKASLASDSDCEQLDYERNCIYATGGATFKQRRWADTFGKLTWYKPRADFNAKDLSTVANANVAEVKRLAAACRAGTLVSADDRKLAEAWLDTFRRGKPELPALDFDRGAEPHKVTKAEMLERILPNRAQLTPTSARIAPGEISPYVKAALPGKKLRAIHIDDRGNCAGQDECGGLTYTLVYDDKNQLVAFEELIVACPVVYLLAPIPVLEGEILKNLDSRGLEQTRSLPISGLPCSGLARVRIAEEKDEITFLDAVSLVIDGTEVLPEACSTGDAAYCTNDGRSLALARGDHLDLTFAIPAGATCVSVRLRANGHYERLH
jgi:hypothetical protein